MLFSVFMENLEKGEVRKLIKNTVIQDSKD